MHEFVINLRAGHTAPGIERTDDCVMSRENARQLLNLQHVCFFYCEIFSRRDFFGIPNDRRDLMAALERLGQNFRTHESAGANKRDLHDSPPKLPHTVTRVSS